MNTVIHDRLAAVLDWMGKLAQDSEAFARAELPELVREVVMWERVQATMWLVICAMAVVAAVGGVRRVFALVDRSAALSEDEKVGIGMHSTWDGWSERRGVAVGMCAIVMVVASIAVLCFVQTSAKAWTSPRLVVLEWVKTMAR
jgi:uncharacterized membrane protein